MHITEAHFRVGSKSCKENIWTTNTFCLLHSSSDLSVNFQNFRSPVNIFSNFLKNKIEKMNFKPGFNEKWFVFSFESFLGPRKKYFLIKNNFETDFGAFWGKILYLNHFLFNDIPKTTIFVHFQIFSTIRNIFPDFLKQSAEEMKLDPRFNELLFLFNLGGHLEPKKEKSLTKNNFEEKFCIWSIWCSITSRKRPFFSIFKFFGLS